MARDIRGSVAWARAIRKAGVLTDKEVDDIVDGLEKVAQRIEERGLSDAAEEDIHSVIERMLGEEVGEVSEIAYRSIAQ